MKSTNHHKTPEYKQLKLFEDLDKPKIHFEDQIKRIKEKLKEAKEIDKNLNVFGASSHQYFLDEPLSDKKVTQFENDFGISLPDCYRSFITEIGNGGNSYANSAAGPFYGIYPLGYGLDELTHNPMLYLKRPVNIDPEITGKEWEEMTKDIDEETLSDEEYDNLCSEIWSGILPIGSQGCTYLHAILLNGEHKGKVVNIDLDFNKPTFTYEDNFLDWYERWLDEVISGDLLADGPNWFGYCMGGDGETLIKKFKESKDENIKLAALEGMFKLASVKEEISEELLNIYLAGHPKFKESALQLIAKFNYPLAIKPLKESIFGNDRECMIACNSIYTYHNSKAMEWVEDILARLPKVSNPETFSFITYLLPDTEIDYGEDIIPFCAHKNEQIRVTAYYTLGLLKNKKKYLEVFKIGLEDKSSQVVHTVLQALYGIKREELLPYYEQILDNYKTDENYILCNVMNRLKELNSKAEKVIRKAAEHTHTETANTARKILKELT